MSELIPHSRPWITDADRAAVQAVLAQPMLAQGAQTRRFETEMAAWMGGDDGIALASGSCAITLALQTLDAPRAGSVVVPSYVCRSVLDAIRAADLRPRLCDSGPDWVVTADSVNAAVDAETVAIIVPHLYGLAADIGGITRIGPPVIEDCAQLVGHACPGPMHAHARVLSFHPTKCLTTGEGGMMIAQDAAMLARARALRDGGETDRRIFSPLSDLAAALGLAQLSRYSSFLVRRREIGARYLAALSRAPMLLRPAWHLADGMLFRFPLRLPGGLERWSGFFARHGVAVRRGVDELLHRSLGLPDDAFPEATHAFDTTVSVPLHPSMSAEEIQRCVGALSALDVMTDIGH